MPNKQRSTCSDNAVLRIDGHVHGDPKRFRGSAAAYVRKMRKQGIHAVGLIEDGETVVAARRKFGDFVIPIARVPMDRCGPGEIDRWLDAGWIDTYRHFDPSPDRYTWWSQRFGVRAKNVGWRIDYVLASPAAMKFVENAMIYSDVQGSDHCPIGVEVDPGVFV